MRQEEKVDGGRRSVVRYSGVVHPSACLDQGSHTHSSSRSRRDAIETSSTSPHPTPWCTYLGRPRESNRNFRVRFAWRAF